MGILLVLAIATTVIGVGLFEYYVNIDTEVTVSANLYWDGSPAEEIIINEDHNEYAGNCTNYTHTLQANNTVTVSFNITNDIGINASVIYAGNAITQLELIGGVLYNIETLYCIDPMATSGNYNATIRVEHL